MVQDISQEAAAEVISKMYPVCYKWGNSGREAVGFVAQDVRELGERLGMRLAGQEGGFLSLPYGSYDALYAAGIQANQQRIERLKQEVRGLQNASFNMPAIGGQNQDIKKVYSYLQMLNNQLRYTLNNITPEDNFTQESFIKYQETDTTISQLEVTMQGFLSQFTDLANELSSSIQVLDGKIALKVSAEDLCSEISATSEAITFKTGYLMIDSQNFKLYKDGTAEFSGGD